MSITIFQFIPPLLPILVIRRLFSTSVTLFLLCKYVHLYHFLKHSICLQTFFPFCRLRILEPISNMEWGASPTTPNNFATSTVRPTVQLNSEANHLDFIIRFHRLSPQCYKAFPPNFRSQSQNQVVTCTFEL